MKLGNGEYELDLWKEGWGDWFGKVYLTIPGVTRVRVHGPRGYQETLCAFTRNGVIRAAKRHIKNLEKRQRNNAIRDGITKATRETVNL